MSKLKAKKVCSSNLLISKPGFDMFICCHDDPPMHGMENQARIGMRLASAKLMTLIILVTQLLSLKSSFIVTLILRQPADWEVGLDRCDSGPQQTSMRILSTLGQSTLDQSRSNFVESYGSLRELTITCC